MKKKMVCFILSAALLLSLLSGCNLQMTMLPQTTKPPATKPSVSLEITEPTQPEETTWPTEIPQPTQPEDLEQPREDPVRPATMPADVPNLENGVYATCGNFYYTVYMDAPIANEMVQFYLMTEKPLPEDAEIVTSLQSKHRVNIYDRTPDTMRVNSDFDRLGASVDWARAYQLNEIINNIYLDYLAGKMTHEEYQAVAAPYREELSTIEDYEGKAKKYSGKPNTYFCYYEVTIYISHYSVDEELTSVDLIAGDMSRTIPVGEIRLRKKVDPSTEELNLKALRRQEGSISSLPSLPYPTPTIGEGQYVIANLSITGHQMMTWDFVAREDITLTEAYFFANGGEDCTILGADVQIAPTNGIREITGDIIQLQWTPGTPLQIRKNDRVRIHLYYVDPWYQMKEYAARHYMVLEYQCGEETGRWLNSTSRYTYRKWQFPCELYLVVFTDEDIEKYYNEYWIPFLKLLNRIRGQQPVYDPDNPPSVAS